MDTISTNVTAERATLITIEYEDPIDGTVTARFAREADALSFEEMLDAEGAWHRRKSTYSGDTSRDDYKAGA
jgi:hypothetical protein